MPQRLSRTLAGVGKCMKERSVIETVNGDRRKEALFARLARGRRGITPPWKSRLVNHLAKPLEAETLNVVLSRIVTEEKGADWQ